MAVYFSFYRNLIIFTLVLSYTAHVIIAQNDNFSLSTAASPTEEAAGPVCEPAKGCRDGVILPRWEPPNDLSIGDKIARAVVYGVALFYMFLGVSIIADRFMASIEVITSKEKEVKVRKADGSTEIITVRIWNETVSNLTLMALGSSAPEILLSVIEICGNNFNQGDLGPNTIVGSAAFNLFVIIAICVYVIPDDEIRRIKHLRVFFVTATWSVFAYIWLYLIIAVFSKGVIEIWEGLVTFSFFPITVISAYIADRKILIYRFLSKKYRRGGKGVLVVAEGDTEMAEINHVGEAEAGGKDENISDEAREFERHRKEFIDTLRELRKKNPDMDMRKLEEMAQYEAMNKGPKSRAFYRIQATRKMMGGGNVVKKSKIQELVAEDEIIEDEEDDGVIKVFFEPAHHTVLENVGSFDINVTKRGGDPHLTVKVDYHTEDGSANAGNDYVAASGTLVFYPDEIHKQFAVSIIDDDVFEEDEHFYVHLDNLRLYDKEGRIVSNSGDPPKARLVLPSSATVMILDDDHGGIFHFDEAENTVVESCGHTNIKIIRSSGARGVVNLPYWTTDGTGKSGKSFEGGKGELTFENEQTSGFIKINVIDSEQYEKKETFFIHLGEPYHVKEDEREIVPDPNKSSEDGKNLSVEDKAIAALGKPTLGELIKTTVIIKESDEFKTTVDSLVKRANVSLMVGTSSWREQFLEALTVSAGEGDDDDEGDDDAEPNMPSCSDYVMHYLTLFWKILFALVPPTDYLGGWLCFTISIIMIGVLTAFIGDLASHFGCTIGLKDSVTAISLVALGTSVPDTFASKVAAIQDDYADSSIGNVTGSNAVNVFLGIGIAWTLASCVHAFNNTQFIVTADSLGFSVTVFCIMALVAIFTLVMRRRPSVGGELGGPRKFKIPTAMLLVSLWLIYVLMSTLESYCVIKGF